MMDAVKFIKELRRMCDVCDVCVSCPAHDCECQSLENMVKDTRIVAIVEEWSAAHPRKTRQSVFLEQWPEAKIDNDGCLSVCPYNVSAAHRDKYGRCVVRGKSCCECRREFWMQEVE